METNFVSFAGVVAASVFVASRAWELWREQQKVTKNNDSFIRGLFAEVDYNTSDLTTFNGLRPSFSDLFLYMENNSNLVPHITDAQHTVIYSQNLQMLSSLPDEMIRDAVMFYGDLEKITQIIAGLDRASFGTISTQGKLKVFEGLYKLTGNTADLGLQVLDTMKREFPHLDLKRKERRNDPRPLEIRMKTLISDLDRVRLRHKSP